MSKYLRNAVIASINCNCTMGSLAISSGNGYF